jgi:hypothetical protein
MTEEQFKNIKELKDKMDLIKSKINTIENLIQSKTLSCKVEGVSDCKFRYSQFIYLTNEESIKLLLENQKEIFEKELITLEETFSTL